MRGLIVSEGLRLADTMPAGIYSGTGVDALTVENAGGQGGAIGPAVGRLDLRMSYRVALATGRTLEIGADVFNVTNEPTFSNPSGDQRQPTFLVPTALVSGGIPRQMQVAFVSASERGRREGAGRRAPAADHTGGIRAMLRS